MKIRVYHTPAENRKYVTVMMTLPPPPPTTFHLPWFFFLTIFFYENYFWEFYCVGINYQGGGSDNSLGSSLVWLVVVKIVKSFGVLLSVFTCHVWLCFGGVGRQMALLVGMEFTRRNVMNEVFGQSELGCVVVWDGRFNY